MSDQSNSELILVLGGTGKTGRRIVQRLAKRGFETIIGSRSAKPPFARRGTNSARLKQYEQGSHFTNMSKPHIWRYT